MSYKLIKINGKKTFQKSPFGWNAGAGIMLPQHTHLEIGITNHIFVTPMQR